MREWLKNIRVKYKFTQKDVASKADISTQYYNFIETGQRRPSPEVAQAIAKVLNFDWTLFYSDDVQSA